MSHSPKIAIVVPARAGSTGIIGKNLQKVAGRELVLRAIQHASFLAASVEGLIILSTDSEEVIDLAKLELGLVSTINAKDPEFFIYEKIVLHYRPSSLATSESLIMETLTRIRSGLALLNFNFEKWCLLQPTSPFRSRSAINSVAKVLTEKKSQGLSLVSLTQVEDSHPARMYQLHDGHAIPLQGFDGHYYSRRQDLPPVFIRDGAYYLFGDDLVSAGIQYSESPEFLLQEYPWNINIDSPVDLQLARMVESQLVLDDPNS